MLTLLSSHCYKRFINADELKYKPYWMPSVNYILINFVTMYSESPVSKKPVGILAGTKIYFYTELHASKT